MYVEFPKKKIGMDEERIDCHTWASESNNTILYGYNNYVNPQGVKYTTRYTFRYIDGEFYLERYGSMTNSNGYNPTCLEYAGVYGIYYHPEVQVYFPFMAIALITTALLLIYHLIIKRLMP